MLDWSLEGVVSAARKLPAGTGSIEDLRRMVEWVDREDAKSLERIAERVKTP